MPPDVVVASASAFAAVAGAAGFWSTALPLLKTTTAVVMPRPPTITGRATSPMTVGRMPLLPQPGGASDNPTAIVPCERPHHCGTDHRAGGRLRPIRPDAQVGRAGPRERTDPPALSRAGT